MNKFKRILKDYLVNILREFSAWKEYKMTIKMWLVRSICEAFFLESDRNLKLIHPARFFLIFCIFYLIFAASISNEDWSLNATSLKFIDISINQKLNPYYVFLVLSLSRSFSFPYIRNVSLFSEFGKTSFSYISINTHDRK
jgi:hypothetical protein